MGRIDIDVDVAADPMAAAFRPLGRLEKPLAATRSDLIR